MPEDGPETIQEADANETVQTEEAFEIVKSDMENARGTSGKRRSP